MNKRTLTYALFAGLTATAALGAYRAHAATRAVRARGTAVVYKGIPEDQIEQISTADRIRSAANNPARPPSLIWQALEHGEKVDCLDCIPAVEPLLYDNNAKNREIAAWWLRRRIFGVFGPGEVYSRVVDTLRSDASPVRRARAAEALGEFLDGGGVAPVASALANDTDAGVRAAATRALDRLNSVGPKNELATALSDADEGVRAGALRAAIHVHGFTDVAAVARLLGDSSAVVRRHAASSLGLMHASASVAALIAITSPAVESDAGARAEAVHSLGVIGDSSARDAIIAAKGDPDSFVRDAASMALRRL